MPLPAQPLEFSDFSGGITENVLQGDPRRYEKADNLFIRIDKKLEERPPFVLDGEDSSVITGASGQRINGYYNLQNDSVLMPQVSRNLYYKNQTNIWTRIQGIDSKSALSGGDKYSQTTFAEFQKTIYFATDGQPGENGVLPSKIYKDDTNTWVARTAGLPRSYVDGNYTDGSLLAKCITNANALRTAMILHFNDAKYPTYTAPGSYAVSPGDLHVNIDRPALCYFQSVTFGSDPNAPSPLPTPQAACTNQATMFTLVEALNIAYGLHVTDAMLNSWGMDTEAVNPLLGPYVPPNPPVYHQDMPVHTYDFVISGVTLKKTKGPGAPLENAALPDSVEEAAAMLDDLWQKWNWHRQAVNTHDELNNPAVFDRYAPVGSKVGTVQIGLNSFATITSDWGEIIDYTNNLRNIFNSHVTNTPGAVTNSIHKQRDNSIYDMQTECTLAEATDLDSAYLLIYWLRSLYQLHWYDISFRQTLAACTSVAGSPTLSAFVGLPNYGLQFVFFVVNTVEPKLNSQAYSTPTYVVAYMPDIVSNDLDRKVVSNSVGQAVQVSYSQYHSHEGGTGVYLSTPVESGGDALGADVTTYGTSLGSWLALAQDVFFSLANHMAFSEGHLGWDLYGEATYLEVLDAVPYLNFYIPTFETVSYATYFSDEYTVEQNGIEYLIQGNPVLSDSVEIPVSYPVGYTPPSINTDVYPAKPVLNQRGTTLTNLPVLVNDQVTNYAVANINLNIYRTTDGGQTYYLLAEVPNGTTSYLDVVNDSVPNPGDTALNTREKIYTSGGVVGFDQPPVCKFTHILNNTAYWGGVVDDDQFFANRIRQSVPNAPDAAPATFFDDLDSPVTGISSTRNNVIVFCSESIYRLAGQFNLQGQGQITHENISDTLGCLNAKGIVRTEIGVFFAGNDGFYYTDGYQVIPITLELKRTYQSLTESEAQRKKIYGAYDRITRTIWWAMCESPTDTDNSVVYRFYLEYGVKPSGTFTRVTAETFRPSSLVFQNGDLYLTHEAGYLLKADPLNKADIIVDTTLSPSLWNTGAIPYDYKSVAVDMGSIFNRKWLTKVHLVGPNVGNVGMQPYMLRDLNQTGQGRVALAPINYVENCFWSNSTLVWGDSSFVWKEDGKMDLWRRFPATTLRSDFMQIQFVPSDKCVYSSSANYPDFCFVTIDSVTKLATIVSPTGYTDVLWPADCVGYRLKLSYDSYVLEYEVLAIDATEKILTLSDSSNTLITVTTPGVAWEIWGVRKQQKFELTSYVLHFAFLGSENQSYPGSKSNSGPGNGGQNP